MWRNLILALVIFLLFVPVESLAQELTTSRSLALGEALSASASGTSAVWHNPAGIASSMMYAAEAGYNYNNQKGGHGVLANIMDMKSNAYVGTAFGFLYEYAKIDGQKRHFTQTRMGLAVPLADGLVSLGVTGFYTNSKLGGKKEISQFSMDAGLIIRPLSWFSLGFSAQNLIVGDYADKMPRKLSTGIAFSALEFGLSVMGEFVFNVSAKSPKDTAEYAAGVEYFLLRTFPLRIAYRYESIDKSSIISAGVGYRDKKGIIGLDLSYQHHFAKIKNDIFSTSFSVYF